MASLRDVTAQDILPSIHCDSCDDTGYVQWINPNIRHGQDGYCRVFPCRDCDKGRALNEQRLERMFKKGGMPPQYKNYRLKDFWVLDEQTRHGKELAISAVTLFCEQYPAPFTTLDIHDRVGINYIGASVEAKGVAIFGNYGTGKTALVSAAANILIELGVDVMFIKLIELIKRVQATYKDNKTSADEIIATAQDAQVLILDECNISNMTDDKREILERIIYERNNRRNKPYILTMNVNKQQFQDMWDGRIASRVNQDCHWVIMNGVPLRPDTPVIGDV